MDSDQLRTAVAELVLAGDLQELLNLYAGGDVALGPDDIARLYDSDALSSEDRQALDQIRAAIPDGLLPPLDRRATVPAEMVELVARCALERGKDGLAVRALREADSLAKFQRMYADFGLDSLQAGDGARAAFELSLAGRLGWALAPPNSRPRSAPKARAEGSPAGGRSRTSPPGRPTVRCCTLAARPGAASPTAIFRPRRPWPSASCFTMRTWPSAPSRRPGTRWGCSESWPTRWTRACLSSPNATPRRWRAIGSFTSRS